MSGAAAFVLRAVDPQSTAKEIVKADHARDDAQQHMVDDVAKRWPGYVPMVFNKFDGSFWVNGIALDEGYTRAEEPPPGFRYDQKSKSMVPAKRTPEGKALAEDLNQYDFFYPKIAGLGDVVHAYADSVDTPSHLRRGYFTGWSFFVFGYGDETTAWAALGIKYPDARDVARGEGNWGEAPLSEFYAAKEQHEGVTA